MAVPDLAEAEFSVARIRELETASALVWQVWFSCGSSFFLWNAIDHRAICGHEILRRRCFDLRCCDVLERRQQRVDLLRVVAEKGQRREQMRFALAALELTVKV